MLSVPSAVDEVPLRVGLLVLVVSVTVEFAEVESASMQIPLIHPVMLPSEIVVAVALPTPNAPNVGAGEPVYATITPICIDAAPPANVNEEPLSPACAIRAWVLSALAVAGLRLRHPLNWATPLPFRMTAMSKSPTLHDGAVSVMFPPPLATKAPIPWKAGRLAGAGINPG